MDVNEGTRIKNEPAISIRCAKAAMLLSLLNRQLSSSTNLHLQNDGNEVLKLKSEVEDLKNELLREKVMKKKMDRSYIWTWFLNIHISLFILTFLFLLCYVFFTD